MSSPPRPQQVPPARLTAVGQAEPGQAVPRRPEPAQPQRHSHRRPHPAAAPSALGGTELLWGRHPTAPGPPRPAPTGPAIPHPWDARGDGPISRVTLRTPHTPEVSPASNALDGTGVPFLEGTLPSPLAHP